MFYCIKYALNTADCDRIIDLCKHGNMFQVVVWNKVNNSIEKKHETHNYSNAAAIFNAWCHKQGATFITNTAQTWDATDFD